MNNEGNSNSQVLRTIDYDSFGRVTGTLAGGGPRNIQLAGRLEF